VQREKGEGSEQGSWTKLLTFCPGGVRRPRGGLMHSTALREAAEFGAAAFPSPRPWRCRCEGRSVNLLGDCEFFGVFPLPFGPDLDSPSLRVASRTAELLAPPNTPQCPDY
jgi:hypothetical protein